MMTLRAPALVALTLMPWLAAAQPAAPGEELLAQRDLAGRRGGRLVMALRTEPRTLNPVAVTDAPSGDVIARMHADLIHIDRLSQLTTPAVAASWTASPDGREYTLKLRKGLRFSDGHAFDADDVLFTFEVLLDEKVRSPQRDLLIVGGRPIGVSRVNAQTVRFSLAQPNAAAERLFDSIAILPRHLLETPYRQGRLAQTWTLTTSPAEIAGLGPFRLKEYVPGQRLVLERNPHYWKVDRDGERLPYLDELVFVFAGTEDAQVMRFQGGANDLLVRTSADNFAVLSRQQQARGYQLRDLGPGLEYSFLSFNLNDLRDRKRPELEAKQRWFGDVNFRRAVSRAIDRDAVVKLAYRGRAPALWGNVSPGNERWINRTLPRPARSLDEARRLLRSSGFSWRSDGALVDAGGRVVEFSIASSSSNRQRLDAAALIQHDLEQLGMRVQVVPLDFRALVDRVYQTFDYEACLLGFGGGDADPNAEMNVWLSGGGNHIWRLGQREPGTTWEAEIDRLMARQLVTLDYAERKRLYDRVQELIAEHQPMIFLAAPHVLVAARADLANFKPAALDTSGLWNADELFFTRRAGNSRFER